VSNSIVVNLNATALAGAGTGRKKWGRGLFSPENITWKIEENTIRSVLVS
jgi:hypothetical protein